MSVAAAYGLMANGGASLSFLRILRMLRVLRMLRLMKSWKGLYSICMTMLRTLPQMSNLFVLTFLLLLILSLLGMQASAAKRRGEARPQQTCILTWPSSDPRCDAIPADKYTATLAAPFNPPVH